MVPHFSIFHTILLTEYWLISYTGKNTGISPAQLLVPLSFASILGGTCTLIGTSTNLVVAGLLTDAYPDDPSMQMGWVKMQFGQLFPYIALTPFITFPLLPAASLILASLEFPLHSLEWHTSSSQDHIFYKGVNGRKTEAFPRMMMARSFWGHVSWNGVRLPAVQWNDLGCETREECILSGKYDSSIVAVYCSRIKLTRVRAFWIPQKAYIVLVQEISTGLLGKISCWTQMIFFILLA